MCDKCFDKEYKKFGTDKEYEDVKFNLEQKLSEKDGLFLLSDFTVYDKPVFKYKCNQCNNYWFLVANNFLVQEKTFEEEAKSRVIGQQIASRLIKLAIGLGIGAFLGLLLF